MSDKSIKLYVTTHKRFILPENGDKALFVPILCGAQNYDPAKDDGPTGPNAILPSLGDNTGDNISEKNPYYSELTGLYWIWKEGEDADYIGINHYRRYFLENGDSENFITRQTILSDLENYDFLVHGPGSDEEVWYNEDFSVYNGYKEMHNIRDLDNALEACKNLFPDIYDAVNYEVHNCTCMCLHNLMLCKQELYKEYCSWLFPILFEVEERADFDKDYDSDYQQRVCAFLPERLFRAWLVAKKYKFKNQNIFFGEIME